MSASRTALIPWYHIIAELAACPLSSETALRAALTHLDPKVSGSTGNLWRAAERDLLHACPSLSLDELLNLRDRLWFEDVSHGARSLYDYLQRIARCFLRHDGTAAVPSFDGDDFERAFDTRDARARSAWRWLSLALPPDLLFAALGDGTDCPIDVDCLSPALARRLEDDGFAEVHLHLGAALNFPILWAAILHRIAAPSFRGDAFASPGACLEEGKAIAPWLLRVAIARYLLAVYLAQFPDGHRFDEFTRHIHAQLIRRLGSTGVAVLATAIHELMDGKLSRPPRNLHSALQLIYADLTSIRMIRKPERLDQVWLLDPITPLMDPGGPRPESWFIWRGLTYLERHPRDAAFATLFWQVIRVRCLFYRHVTQRPMTPGLQWFVRFYSRLSPGRKSLGTRVLVESAGMLDGLTHGLRSLEVRTSPDRSTSETFSLIKDAAKVFADRSAAGSDMFTLLRDTDRTLVDPHCSSMVPPENDCSRRPGEQPVSGKRLPPEFGFVLHFARERGGGADKGRPTAFWRGGHADPSIRSDAPRGGNPSGYRYARFYMERREQAYALGRLLAMYPLALEHIRGLDLCTDEVGVPTWVMAPLLRYVRDAGEAAARLLKRQHGIAVTPLRTTVHAGEDFVHLLSGLRRLDEAIDRLHLRTGDRLGHALALGVDARGWAARAGRIAMPKEERLLDLVWEWSWRSRNGGAASSNRRMFIDREIARLSEELFGKRVSALVLERLVDDLHKEIMLRWARFPSGPVPDRRPERRHRLLLRLLTDPTVFKRGREVLWVDPAGEGDALDELQRALRRKVGARSITVEVNPSSNLLIGQLAHFGEHPLWRLRPYRPTDGVPPVVIAIGSDDPLTFATNLRQEYQLVYDALLLDGCSAEEAEAWVEGVRKASLNARFTIPRTGLPITEYINAPGFPLDLLP